MEDVKLLADLTIPKFNGTRVVYFADGNTDDIITVVNKTHPFAVKELQGFAKGLTGTNFQKCKKIYLLLADNVKLEHDQLGIQDVQKPSSLWHRKAGDCKSYSLFIAGCLQNLGIPYEYKYISQHPLSNKVTHVYVVAYPAGVRIVMDVNLKKFNKEVKTQYFNIIKKSSEMAEIAMVGQIGRRKKKKGFARKLFGLATGTSLFLEGRQALKNRKNRKKRRRIGSLETYIDDELNGVIPSEIADLWRMKDRVRAEKKAVASMTGIGSLKYQKYNDIEDGINDMLYGIGRIDNNRFDEYVAMIADDMENGVYRNFENIAGIGATFNSELYAGKAMQRERKKIASQRYNNRVARLNAGTYPITESRTEIGNIFKKMGKGIKKASKKVGKGIKKVAKGVAKGVKAVAKTVQKVSTAPIRLFVTPRLKKSGPAFLYTFLTDAQAKKVPAKVQQKRTKQLRIKNLLIKALAYDNKRLTADLRTSIISHYKKSPESVLQDMFKGQINGIGWIVSAVSAVVAILQKLFGKKAEKFDKNDVPDESDFAGFNSAAMESSSSSQSQYSANDNYGSTPTYNNSNNSGYSANLYNADGSDNDTSDYADSKIFDNGGKKSTGICNF